VSDVRNGVLGRLVTATYAWTPVFTVPAGFTVLLKAVHAFNNSGAAGQLVVRLVAAAGPATAYLPPFDLAANEVALWQGETALNHADQLQVLGSAPGFHVWTFGANLPGQVELLPVGELLEAADPINPRGAELRTSSQPAATAADRAPPTLSGVAS
jgi:hypothetical protein